MNHKGKWMSLLTAAVVLGSAATGCSSSGGQGSASPTANSTSAPSASEPAKKASEPYSFTYLRPVWGPTTYTKGGPMEQEYEKRSNVHMDISIVPVADYNAKANAVLASGDLPDVMWASGPADQTFADAEQQGAFLPINKYLNKYPALKNMFPQEVWDEMKNEKGDIYFIPNPLNGIKPFYTFYRKDWFDKLGIPEPKTLEDLASALEKIKNSDPDGNGKNDTIPLTLGSPWFFNFLGTGFGAAPNSWNVNPDNPNEIIPSFADKRLIDLYFWEQDLHNKGLLDPEFQVSLNPTKSKDKFKNGQAAVYVNVGLDDALDLSKSLKQSGGQLGIMMPLSGPGGAGGNRLSAQYDRGFYVSAKIKNPDRLFEYFNWALTDGYELERYGIEGKTYYVKNGVKVPMQTDQREKDYQSPMLDPLRTVVPLSERLYDWDVIKLQYDDQGESEIYKRVKEVYDAFAAKQYVDQMKANIRSATDKKIGKQIGESYINEMVNSVVISNKITRDVWTKRLDDWKKAGGDKIIQEINQSRNQLKGK